MAGGVLGVGLFLFSKVSGAKPVLKKKLPGIKYPVYIRIGTTDASVLRQVLIERQYDLDLPLPTLPRIIVDAGANIGLSAVFFANKYPDAAIFAVEPEESNFQLLKRNVSRYPQIRPLHMALWGESRQIHLIDPGDGHHGFQTVKADEVGNGQRRKVQAITMEDLITRLELNYVDILKVDIEGAEKEVFENSLGWIDRVGVIMVELHDHLKVGCREAFVSATKAFPEEFFKGETVIRLRKRINV